MILYIVLQVAGLLWHLTLTPNFWLSDIGYTTGRKLHEHEPDGLKVSLESDSCKSGIL